MIGPIQPPVAASTNNVPTIGPVHENETNANVNAIKKIPINPPLDSAATLLFVHEDGNCNSNAPKKEAPNIINNRKKPILKYTLVAILFNASAPNIEETPTPKATYIIIIETPYIIAFSIPSDFVLDFFVKKETVMGIIGKTQGVNNAAKPLKNATKNNIQKLLAVESELLDFMRISSLLLKSLSLLKSKENSTISGGKHCLSSQVI